ncbi:GNAT family N-acetyltransferase [Pseudomonas sp. LS-2]|uniref:GNAT family N-acetyltransferase n=1 Tax=Pseudomonas sp. LS-2 TaxID=2315859 RepID=UPI000E76B0B2|nr:GNAT family N-acetyltransferase [Pseudomonas sp. LS-2]RJX77402.1 N-acetyltransferase [Pseudomonas sp. LS-2]
MQSFSVRELSSGDTDALLAFEAHNREWFESQIDARDPAFYTSAGVAEHIERYLSDFASGIWHPFVIQDPTGRIVGRANLKAIDSAQGLAEVGYRVGQEACGKGVATLALKHLIQQARSRWALTALVAYVYPDNIGSQKVLDRCGFVPEPRWEAQQIGTERRFVLTLSAPQSAR